MRTRLKSTAGLVALICCLGFSTISCGGDAADTGAQGTNSEAVCTVSLGVCPMPAAYHLAGSYICDYGITTITFRGLYHIFVVGKNYAVYHSYYAYGYWHPWENLGGIAYSKVSVPPSSGLAIEVTGGDCAGATN